MINKETLNYADITILEFENIHKMDEIIKRSAPSI